MANYYVDPVEGSDAGDGGYLDPWKTTPYALTQVADNDTIYLIASGTETLTVPFDMTGKTVVTMIGVDISLNLLAAGQKYQLDCSGLDAGVLAYDAPDTTNALILRSIRAFNGPFGFSRLTNNSSGLILQHCRLDHFGAAAITGSGVSSYINALSTEIDNNNGGGIIQSVAWRVVVRMNGCSIHHNVGSGIRVNGLTLKNCLVYRNTDRGLWGNKNPNLFNNTIFDNGSHGYEGNATSGSSVVRNSFSQNGGYALYLIANKYNITENHFYNNTSGESNLGAGNTPGLFNVAGDPLFTSVTDNEEDFTPKSGSPLIGVPPTSVLIGAVCPVSDGGGIWWSPFESMRVR